MSEKDQWKTTGQEGHFIPEHPCLEEAQLPKKGVPGSVSAPCTWCAGVVSGDDPLMQTRAQGAKDWEGKNSLG